MGILHANYDVSLGVFTETRAWLLHPAHWSLSMIRILKLTKLERCWLVLTKLLRKNCIYQVPVYSSAVINIMARALGLPVECVIGAITP